MKKLAAQPHPGLVGAAGERAPRQSRNRTTAWLRTVTALLTKAATVSTVAAGIAGCASEQPTVLPGRAMSMRYDPAKASGLPVTDSPSGLRQSAPAPTGSVRNTDHGATDQLMLLAVNDVEDYWNSIYRSTFGADFEPVSFLLSVDPADQTSPRVCGDEADEVSFNALYCPTDNSINWDRSEQSGLVTVARKYFGDMGVVGITAHEYGHAVQYHAGLVARQTGSLIKEQQADCFAGSYLRWAAEGHSPRFALSTGDGLSHVLAGAIAIRDPLDGDPLAALGKTHGTALDRVSAVQMGFDQGPKQCAKINGAEIRRRRGGLPASLFDPGGTDSDTTIDASTLTTTLDILNQIFHPAHPPMVSTNSPICGDPAQSAAYCTDTNTIAVDLPKLAQMGAPADESQHLLIQGDNTALSAFTSRYVLALQHERNLPLDTPEAAMRTACLTGAAQRAMTTYRPTASGQTLMLGPGDLDEAVAGLLTNGVAASDVRGIPVPAGFTRISAYRAGLLGDNPDACYQKFP
ncbi:neutral zinc metallopeptidase [Mycolicibacterium sphagni]|nr:neutral zinc metallopeptidase [Mycolicibacterium sphagni]